MSFPSKHYLASRQNVIRVVYSGSGGAWVGGSWVGVSWVVGGGSWVVGRGSCLLEDKKKVY